MNGTPRLQHTDLIYGFFLCNYSVICSKLLGPPHMWAIITPEPIVLNFLLVMLCCTAHKMFSLCSTKCPICTIMLNHSIATICCQYTSTCKGHFCLITCLPCWATDMFLLIAHFLVRSDFCGVLKRSRSDTLSDTCATPGPESETVLPVPLDSLSDTESMPTSLSV